MDGTHGQGGRCYERYIQVLKEKNAEVDGERQQQILLSMSRSEMIMVYWFAVPAAIHLS